MKKIDLGQAITIIANLGVIAGIVFLGLELQQNQTVGRAATRNEIAAINLQINQFQSSQVLADIVFRSDRGEPLTPEEAWQIRQWLNSWLLFWDNVNYQYRNGLYDDSEYQSELEKIRIFLNSRNSAKTQYCIVRSLGTVSSDLVAVLDELLDEPCPSVIEDPADGDIRPIR